MIEARGLVRVFGKLRAVDGLDLSIPAGELYGFLGPNGAGKTTTLRMLTGLLQPSAGELRIAGLSYRENARAVRAISAFVPDAPPLYEFLTGRQYLGLVASLYGVPPAQRDAEMERLFRLFGLAAQADQVCRTYSHGMKKKLHLAAMLATGPRVLFLDEPTTGLDPRSVRGLKDLLQSFCAAGGTVLLSTHSLAIAEQICHRIGILDRGRLKAEGTMPQLRGRAGQESLEDIFLRLTEDAAHDDLGAAQS